MLPLHLAEKVEGYVKKYKISDKYKNEIIKKANFGEKFKIIKNRITSQDFRNALQGVYGKIDDKTFEKYKEALLKLDKIN